MKTTLKSVLTVLAIAVLGFTGAPSVEAASIRVSDGSTTIIINDNDGNDLANPILGVVAFAGPIGDFLVNFEFGVTKPVVGSPTSPLLALTIGAVSGAVGGTLTIDFSEIGFGPTGSGGSLALAIGLGASSGTVTYETYFDPTNTLFGGIGGPTLTSETGGSGPIVFGQTESVPTTASFSLTQRLIITHGAGQTTSLGASPNQVILALTPVPDGGWAVGLLGFALMGVEGLRRKYTRL